MTRHNKNKRKNIFFSKKMFVTIKNNFDRSKRFFYQTTFKKAVIIKIKKKLKSICGTKPDPLNDADPRSLFYLDRDLVC